jgi:phosphoglycolate phosphatase
MTRAVIFDLDGTLIDTPNAIVQMMQNALLEMGLEKVHEDQIRKMIGLPLEDGAAAVLRSMPDSDDTKKLVQLYRSQFLNWMVPQSKQLLFPGVSSGLKGLKEAGWKIGLATSKYLSSAEAVLKSSEIIDFFDALAGSDSVTKQKPNPEMALYVCTQLLCEPEHTVVVGDTIHDLKMGLSAGMNTMAVSYGVGCQSEFLSANPTSIADTFDQVVSNLMSPPTPKHKAARVA